VTLLDSPSGAPTTTTGWPTGRSAEDPNALSWGDGASGAFITARSVSGSRPTRIAGTRWPSLSITSRPGQPMSFPVAAGPYSQSLTSNVPSKARTEPVHVDLSGFDASGRQTFCMEVTIPCK
jgi:hypothetical protein